MSRDKPMTGGEAFLVIAVCLVCLPVMSWAAGFCVGCFMVGLRTAFP